MTGRNDTSALSVRDLDFDTCDFTTLALVRAASLNEASRSIEVVASTDTPDAYGDVLDQSTWKLDRYRANPVVLWAHKQSELPIGTASDVKFVAGTGLVATLTFVSEALNPQAERVWQQIKAGVLRAVSVGFMPSDYRMETRSGRDVWVLSGLELFEISVCPVPANPDTLARRKSMQARLAPAPAVAGAAAPAASSTKPTEATPMKSIATTLGLAQDATEDQIAHALATLNAANARLLGEVGAKSADEAVGAIRALKADHDLLVQAQKELAEIRATQEAAERSDLLEKAVRKLGPAIKEAIGDMPITALRAFVEKAPQAIPVNDVREPAKPQAGALVDPATGKSWGEMSMQEKHRLGNDHPDIFAAMREAAAAAR